ncbi:hypothetical protein P170DRAFT_365558 [Aspergillus steynii IBT 23096]|uniref:Cytochrome b5 heme-binding domain-containing protein n=1 Tax=Aspergillus steynii IBT 23096 TaxID=1392250 RepID=A0A2I2FY45_9EURO|nr:uncharacterized protein P170DRAFT_365558 [Aspergillus steynii IBT 23096]PLB45555.1 hypothetical protein P170DRAFT_365558 [Aspergillus steynii IBT 23096]
MGWVGVVTLIATACFVLYKYPPASWTPDSPPPQPRSTSDEPKPPVISDETKQPESQPVEAEDTSAEESQSTPKASASSTPSLEVPTFSLDADRSSSIAQPSPDENLPLPPQEERPQNGSAKPVAIPTAPSPEDSLMPPPTGPLPRRQPNASSSSLMPPPPPPRLRPNMSQNQQQPPSQPSLTAGRVPPRPTTGSNSLRPPPSAASSMRGPLPNRSPNSLAPAKLTAKPSTPAKRAVLEPGYSPLDWAALTSNPKNNLRGANLPPHLIRVTPSQLKAQNGRKGTDAWTSYQGKVYNITPYLPFHPGGRGELLRGAGKDSAKLFFEIHPWVNWDAILGECLVGILVSENDEGSENKLDAMD